MTTTPPAPRTKFFRVARSGKTIDGREISPAQIDQMAASYNPATYGARIWVEHLRSLLPDSPFRAFGDVLSLKAETEAEGGRVLLAEIAPTPDLVKLSADRQKVFWSIELDPNFAGTGQAYLVGLSVTDSPASLGTEMLSFALQSASTPDTVKGHLFSAAVESRFELAETADPGAGLLAKVKDLLSAHKPKGDEARYSQVEGAVTTIAEEVAEIRRGLPAAGAFAAAADVKVLSDKLDDLITRLSSTAATPPRPPHAGGGAAFLETDC